MIIKNNIPVYSISWLNYCEGGIISHFYEPESKEELIAICNQLYGEGKPFDLIGHTSNTYFLPSYNVDYMVSTRRVKNIVVGKDYIDVDCGVSVRSLARQMVEEGVKGFEGLIDLPGTVGASVYGNASCYNCSINSMLVSLELLNTKGEIVKLYPDDLKIAVRSTALKRHELGGVILTVRLKREQGDKETIRLLAEKYRNERASTQPPAADNLGSIFRCSGRPTLYYWMLSVIANIYGLFILLTSNNRNEVRSKKKLLFFKLAGASDLVPYVYGWNRYIWKDNLSHLLFWKYLKLHKRLYTGNDLEIEIKQNV